MKFVDKRSKDSFFETRVTCLYCHNFLWGLMMLNKVLK